MHLAKFLRTL